MFDKDDFAPLTTRDGPQIGKSRENRLVENAGGNNTIATRIRKNPDGSTSMLRTRGGFPEVTTTTPAQGKTTPVLIPNVFSVVGEQMPDEGAMNPDSLAVWKITVNFAASPTLTSIPIPTYIGSDGTEEWKKYRRYSHWTGRDALVGKWLQYAPNVLHAFTQTRRIDYGNTYPVFFGDPFDATLEGAIPGMVSAARVPVTFGGTTYDAILSRATNIDIAGRVLMDSHGYTAHPPAFIEDFWGPSAMSGYPYMSFRGDSGVYCVVGARPVSSPGQYGAYVYDDATNTLTLSRMMVPPVGSSTIDTNDHTGNYSKTDSGDFWLESFFSGHFVNGALHVLRCEAWSAGSSTVSVSDTDSVSSAGFDTDGTTPRYRHDLSHTNTEFSESREGFTFYLDDTPLMSKTASGSNAIYSGATRAYLASDGSGGGETNVVEVSPLVATYSQQITGSALSYNVLSVPVEAVHAIFAFEYTFAPASSTTGDGVFVSNGNTDRTTFEVAIVTTVVVYDFIRGRTTTIAVPDVTINEGWRVAVRSLGNFGGSNMGIVTTSYNGWYDPADPSAHKGGDIPTMTYDKSGYGQMDGAVGTITPLVGALHADASVIVLSFRHPRKPSIVVNVAIRRADGAVTNIPNTFGFQNIYKALEVLP